MAGLDEVAGLTVLTVDPQAALEGALADRADQLAGLLPQLNLPPASSVVPLPGTGELALFAELGRADADLVVVDAGPGRRRLTALLGAARPPCAGGSTSSAARLRALGAVRTAARRLRRRRGRGPLDALLAAVPLVEQLLGPIRLADPARHRRRLVAQPRTGAAAASGRTALALGPARPAAGRACSRGSCPRGDGDWWARRARRAGDGPRRSSPSSGPVRSACRSCGRGARDVADLAELLPDGDRPRAEPLAPVTERLRRRSGS